MSDNERGGPAIELFLSTHHICKTKPKKNKKRCQFFGKIVGAGPSLYIHCLGFLHGYIITVLKYFLAPPTHLTQHKRVGEEREEERIVNYVKYADSRFNNPGMGLHAVIDVGMLCIDIQQATKYIYTQIDPSSSTRCPLLLLKILTMLREADRPPLMQRNKYTTPAL